MLYRLQRWPILHLLGIESGLSPQWAHKSVSRRRQIADLLDFSSKFVVCVVDEYVWASVRISADIQWLTKVGSPPFPS